MASLSSLYLIYLVCPPISPFSLPLPSLKSTFKIQEVAHFLYTKFYSSTLVHEPTSLPSPASPSPLYQSLFLKIDTCSTTASPVSYLPKTTPPHLSNVCLAMPTFASVSHLWKVFLSKLRQDVLLPPLHSPYPLHTCL